MSSFYTPTNFTESNALLAVLSDDPEQAQGILDSMLPHELESLARGARELARLCWHTVNYKQEQAQHATLAEESRA